MSASTQSFPALDLEAVKRKQQITWSSGDFSVVATRIQFAAELLAEAADIRAGSRVLDVATGSGNAAIAAARSGARVTGVDYVPSLLEHGRVRAAAEGVEIEFLEGDAEALPVPTADFDTVLSIYGVMFAPNHQKAADELLRACRPGGRIGLASWSPDGFIGGMFRVVGAHVPPPAGLDSPMRWGDEAYLRTLFGGEALKFTSKIQTCVFRYESPADFVNFFRRWYGPTYKAFEALDERGKASLENALQSLADQWNRNPAGESIAIPATYLQTIIERK